MPYDKLELMEKYSKQSPTNYELGPSLDRLVSPPVSDLLRVGEAADVISSDHSVEINRQISEHAELARNITSTLDKVSDPRTPITEALATGEINQQDADSLYDSLSTILETPEYTRLALYLPFEVIPAVDSLDSPSAARFRQVYLDSWQDLLNIHDVRANFVDGDVLEMDARPGDPPRVVKAAHLIPWLVKAGMMSAEDVLFIAKDTKDSVLKQSISDTIPAMVDMDLLSTDTAKDFTEFADSLPKLTTAEPLFISKARQKWLDSKDNDRIDRLSPDIPLSQLPNLAAPLSANIENLRPEITAIEQSLENTPELTSCVFPVALLGGSRLKGYGTPNSDVDVHLFTDRHLTDADRQFVSDKFPDSGARIIELEEDSYNNLQIAPDEGTPADWAHIVLNTLYIGNPAAIKDLRSRLLPSFFSEPDPTMREFCLERLEQDLLQYRLMHKGYARLMPNYNPEYAKYSSIDGASAFYDSGYRRVATELFVNNVFIPNTNNPSSPDK